MKCPVCKKEISELDEICPNCKTNFDDYERNKKGHTKEVYEGKVNADYLNIMAFINIILTFIGAIAICIYNISILTIITAIGILIAGFTLFFLLRTIVDIYYNT